MLTLLKVTPTRGILSCGLLFVLGPWTAGQAAAQDVSLPRGALHPDTNMVVWFGLESTTPEMLEATRLAFAQLQPKSTPDQTADGGAADGGAADGKAGSQFNTDWEKLVQNRNRLVQAGVRAIVATVNTEASAAAAASGDANQANAAPGGPAKKNGFSLETLMQVRPGSDPREVKRVWVEVNRETLKAKPAELDRLEKMTFKPLGGHWLRGEHEASRPLPAPELALDPTPFVTALAGEDGASLRFAWIMNASAKQAINEWMLQPGAFLFAGMLSPLRSLDAASGGWWVGAQTRFRVSMNFADEGAAATFQQGLNGLALLVTNLTSLVGDASKENELKQERLRATMALLLLDKRGATLSKTIDLSMLKRFQELGVLDSKGQPAGSGQAADGADAAAPGVDQKRE